MSNDTLQGDSAQKIAEKTGVSAKTVKRNGARVEIINALAKPAQAIANEATDAEVKRLAKLSKGDQEKVARVVRVKQAKTVSEAIELAKVKPEGKSEYGTCPSCAGKKWTEGDEGVTCKKCKHPHGEPAGDVDEDHAKKARTLAHSHRDKLARAICDYHELAPNRSERDRLVKLVQGIELW